MDGNQELPPIGEGHAQQVKTPILAVEKDKVPNPLSSRLDQIQSGVRTRSKKISLLVGTFSQGEETGTAVEPISFDTLSMQLDELSKADLAPSEYLMKSKQLLDSSEQVRKQTLAEGEEAQNGYFSHKAAIRDVDYKLEDLGRLRGIKKFTSFFERRRLAQQRVEFIKKAADLQAHADSKRQLANYTYEREKPIRQKQEEVLIGEAAAEIGAVRGDYEKFLGEVINEGTIITDIQNAYIDTVIAPMVDAAADWQKLPDDKKEAFYSALRNCLKNNGAKEEEKQTSRQELDKIAHEDGFYSAKDACQPLLYGSDRGVISNLVGKIAASDIARIKASVDSKFTSNDSRWKFDSSLEKAIDPEGEVGEEMMEVLGR